MQRQPEDLRVRFGLRSIFVTLTGLAIAYALLFSTPPFVALPCLLALSIMLPALLTAGLIYGNGPSRAFCIGGLFPGGMMLVITVFTLWAGVMGGYRPLSNPTADLADMFRILSVISWTLIIFVGACTVVIRQMGRNHE